MFRILIDTCVWLDIAKDHHQLGLLAALEELIKQGKVSLIVPRIVVDEFRRDEERIGKESAQSLRTVLKRVKDAVEQFGDPKKRRTVLAQLDDVNQKMPIKGGSATQTLKRIDHLFVSSTIIETSDAVKLRAAQRALDRKAPFHKNKNEMGDAIILETYADCLLGKGSSGVRFAFVTHNTEDFSDALGDKRRPHADIAPLFSKIKSLYATKLTDVLHRAEPDLVADVLFEHSYMDEPRGLTEILKAMDLLFWQVWYNRHMVLDHDVRTGRVKEKPEITVMRRKAEKRVAKRVGLKNLGPWDDFEWGMLNGKLSALRWVLGDEWDMLDT